MKKLRASKRYASALFEAGLEENVLKNLEADMAVLKQILLDEPEVNRILESPNVSKKDKHQLMQSILGEKVHPLISNLVNLLLDKNREMLLEDIADWFQDLVDEHNKIQRADLISSFPLTEAEKKKIAAMFESSFKKVPVFNEIVDPSVIGGFMIRMPDKIIDATLKNELKRIQESLLAPERN